MALFVALSTGGFSAFGRVLAEERGADFELRVFGLAPRTQRNRVPAEEFPAAVEKALLAALETGARPCDCLPRRLRWAWSLPNPKDPAHPSLVVSFEDRPRVENEILMYERLSLITYREGKYVASGVLTLNRPRMSADASLNVRMLPRRDFDQDGQLDIAVSFVEKWKKATECGRVLFASGAAQPTFEATACPDG